MKKNGKEIAFFFQLFNLIIFHDIIFNVSNYLF